MTTATVLLILVAAASTIAFSPPQYDFQDTEAVPRRRRDVAGAKSSSFSSSSSSSSSSGPGYSTSISSRSGFPDAGQATNYAGNAVNPGGFVHSGVNDFNFPNQNYGNQYPTGYVPVDFNALFRQYMEFMRRVAMQNAYAQNFYNPEQNFQNTVPGGYNEVPAPGFSDISTRGGFGQDSFGAPSFYFPGPSNFGPGGNYGPGNNFGGTPGAGDVSASASASLSPRGGFGSVSINPPPQGNPELATRMGSVPPSGGGGNFAVFSSSSSGSSDDNGVKKSFKEATSVINDNGKVTTYHVSDP